MGRVQTTRSRRKSTRRTGRATGGSQPQPRVETPARSESTGTSLTIVSPWGRVDEEYALIRADLKRLAWVTTVLLALLAALTVLLR